MHWRKCTQCSGVNVAIRLKGINALEKVSKLKLTTNEQKYPQKTPGFSQEKNIETTLHICCESTFQTRNIRDGTM